MSGKSKYTYSGSRPGNSGSQLENPAFCLQLWNMVLGKAWKFKHDQTNTFRVMPKKLQGVKLTPPCMNRVKEISSFLQYSADIWKNINIINNTAFTCYAKTRGICIHYIKQTLQQYSYLILLFYMISYWKLEYKFFKC